MPIIAMTANVLEKDKETALKHGMNVHIANPLDMNIFMSVLKQYLHKVVGRKEVFEYVLGIW